MIRPPKNQGFYANRVPTPMMEKSLLYKLVEHNNKEGVRVNESLGSGFPWYELSLRQLNHVQSCSVG